MALPLLMLGRSAKMATTALKAIPTVARAGAPAIKASAPVLQQSARAASQQARLVGKQVKRSPLAKKPSVPRSGEMVRFFPINAKGRPSAASRDGLVLGLARRDTAKGPGLLLRIAHEGGVTELPYNSKWFDFSRGQPTQKLGQWLKAKVKEPLTWRSHKQRARSLVETLFEEVQNFDRHAEREFENSDQQLER